MINAARSKLRDLAEARLSLYIKEMGREFYERLIANKANWRAGYVPADDCFWCTPQTADGHIIVGPFTVVKWSAHEAWRGCLRRDEQDVLREEARQAGFEKWAAP
jgi:hypothetical protein